MANTYSTVQTAINATSQDLRNQLSAAGSPGQAILIDYCNRISKRMLRFSRWSFILSERMHFMTVLGQTDYWIGATAGQAAGQVDTGLNLTDVDRVMKDSVKDLSNSKQLLPLDTEPVGPGVTLRSGQTSPGLPKVFWHDHDDDPFVIRVFPGADNNNIYQPIPSTPIVNQVVSGALPIQNTFFRITFVDNNGGESSPSNTLGYSFFCPANSVYLVRTPVLPYTKTASGITYTGWNVYAATNEGSETLQNVSPIALGTDWQEPTTGITTTGKIWPSTSTIAEMEGYVIEFRYYKTRVVLSSTAQTLQIPDDYLDILVDGVNYLGWKLLGKTQEAQAAFQAFRDGLTQMVIDKNLFPAPDFVRPDPSAYVNQQLLGILPNTNDW